MEEGFLFWFVVVQLALFNLWQRRIRNAGIDDRRAAEALQRWLEDHPGLPLSWPSAQVLLRERLQAWRNYMRVCPAVRDGGVLERYLESYLEKQHSPEHPDAE